MFYVRTAERCLRRCSLRFGQLLALSSDPQQAVSVLLPLLDAPIALEHSHMGEPQAPQSPVPPPAPIARPPPVPATRPRISRVLAGGKSFRDVEIDGDGGGKSGDEADGDDGLHGARVGGGGGGGDGDGDDCDVDDAATTSAQRCSPSTLPGQLGDGVRHDEVVDDDIEMLLMAPSTKAAAALPAIPDVSLEQEFPQSPDKEVYAESEDVVMRAMVLEALGVACFRFGNLPEACRYLEWCMRLTIGADGCRRWLRWGLCHHVCVVCSGVCVQAIARS